MKRSAVNHVETHFGQSQRKAYLLVCYARTMVRYIRKSNDDEVILEELKTLIARYPRYGLEMLHMKLKRKGLMLNHKKTERIYRQYGLQLRLRKGRRKQAAGSRPAARTATGENGWAMDFVSDSVACKKRLKILTVLNVKTKEAVQIKTDYSITAKDVVALLEQSARVNGYPDFIQCDNGPEFTSRELDQWCYKHNVRLVFSRPGKPTDNGSCESFNGKLRNECLNIHYFDSISMAQFLIENWRIDYNTNRPQKGLQGFDSSGV